MTVSFKRDWPEIWKSEIPPSEFCRISGDWGELLILNLAWMCLIGCYWMLQNSKVTAFTVFELLREIQLGGRGGVAVKLRPPPPPTHTHTHTHTNTQRLGLNPEIFRQLQRTAWDSAETIQRISLKPMKEGIHIFYQQNEVFHEKHNFLGEILLRIWKISFLTGIN